jgi:hypothetical protein
MQMLARSTVRLYTSLRSQDTKVYSSYASHPTRIQLCKLLDITSPTSLPRPLAAPDHPDGLDCLPDTPPGTRPHDFSLDGTYR